MTSVSAVRKVVVKMADGSKKTYRYAKGTNKPVHGEPGSWLYQKSLRAGSSVSVADLISAYRTSSLWSDLAAGTRRNYEEALLRFMDKHGNNPIHDISRATIRSMVDGMKNIPGRARIFLTVTTKLYNFAIDQEWIEYNPSARQTKPKLGTIKRWPEDRIDPTIEGLNPNYQTPCYIGLYTGQRLFDVLSMKWSDYDSTEGLIKVQQDKGNQESLDITMYIPVHPKLAEHLDSLPRKGETICLKKSGEPWENSQRFCAAFRRYMLLAKMDDYSFHGLRKSAASRLAEGGCTALEIMAITGHKTLNEVERYTREAEQLLRAKSAMRKMRRSAERRKAEEAGELDDD